MRRVNGVNWRYDGAARVVQLAHRAIETLLSSSAAVAARLLEKGVYAIGFFFPVVPQGTARIRAQISAAHSREDLDFAIGVFAEVKEEFGF